MLEKKQLNTGGFDSGSWLSPPSLLYDIRVLDPWTNQRASLSHNINNGDILGCQNSCLLGTSGCKNKYLCGSITVIIVAYSFVPEKNIHVSPKLLDLSP